MKNFYKTWRKAGKAAVALGIKTNDEYRVKYFDDKMLPSNPGQFYKDFPGWRRFLGNQNKHRGGVTSNFYKHWKKACQAAYKLGIETSEEYEIIYHYDIRLPSNIYLQYPKFPGFPISKALGIKIKRIKKKAA